MNIAIFLLYSIIGFFTNKHLTHPHSSLHNKLPYIKIKFIQISPHIKLNVFGRTIHFHHWLNYGIILIISFTFSHGLLETYTAKGLLVGSIVQGFTYHDWKHFIIKQE